MAKKVLKICFKVVKVALACLIILFTAIILLQRFSNSTISFGGYRIFAVVTGSMEPVYSVGDVLVCKNIDTNTLKEGDDITYLGKEGSFKDKVVTHRIMKIIEKDGKRTFITKGVANNSSDPPVDPSQIYGKVSKKLYFFSLLHRYASTGIGFFLFVILPIMALVGSEIVQTMLERHAKQVGGIKQDITGQSTSQQPIVQNDGVGQSGVTPEQLQQQLANLQQQLMTQQQNLNTQQQAQNQVGVVDDGQTNTQQVVDNNTVVQNQQSVNQESVSNNQNNI